MAQSQQIVHTYTVFRKTNRIIEYPNLNIDNTIIEQVTDFFLGLTFDEHFKLETTY